jgi:hypothetical protein
MNAAPSAPPPPSGRQLAIASVGAAGVAAVLLVVAVLPAEYGIDPLGTGAALGLISPAAADAPGAPGLDQPAVATAAETEEARLTPSLLGPVSYYAAPYAFDHIAFTLGPYEYVEYKYRLEQGASVHFAWEASAPVMHDLHADPDGAEDHDPVSFDARERTRAFGTHTAPFPGMHGWLWENPGSEVVTVSLTSAGFFRSATEYRSNGTRVAHDVEALGTLADVLVALRAGNQP